MNYAKQHLAVLGKKAPSQTSLAKPEKSKDKGKRTLLKRKTDAPLPVVHQSPLDTLKNMDFGNADVTLFERLGRY